MNTYTILGEEVVLCEKKIADILAAHQVKHCDVTIYDMKEATIQKALFDVQTASFLNDKRAVLVKNPEFLTGVATKNEAHDLEAFTKFLENQQTENILIIYAPYEKLDERKKMVKLLKKKTEYITFTKYTEESLKQWLIKKLTEKGISFEIAAIDLLLQLTKAKMDTLYQELEKIDLYFLNESDKQLTAPIVRQLITRQQEENIFLLTDAILQHKTQEAYHIYRDLLTQNEEPLKLLILIGNQFRLMKQTLGLSKQGYPEGEMAKALGMHPYRIKMAHQQARRFSQEAIEKYLYQIAELDYKIKTGAIQNELALELLILNVGGKTFSS